MAQLDMFAADAMAGVSNRADPERVRRKLAALLTEAQGAATGSLPAARRRLIEVLVPQMTQWLPEAEAAEVRAAVAQALAGGQARSIARV